MALGTFGGGTGTSGDPYIIEDADDLNAIRTKSLTAYYKLKNNINLNVAPYNTGTGWTPISSFTGQIDGAGFLIMNLMINNPTANDLGLFNIFNGYIHDLGMVNVNITGADRIGAFAARVTADSIQFIRCFANGTITGNNKIGGLVGEINNQSNTYFTHCHSGVNLNITYDHAGGIIGYALAPFSNNPTRLSYCYYNGTIAGGNLVTSQPLFGTGVNIYLNNCFWDKEKTSQNQVNVTNMTGTAPTALTAAQFKDPDNFPNWQYTYFNNYLLWRFPIYSYPQLWFEGLGSMILYWGGHYYSFNTDWVDLGVDMPDKATIIAQGMKTLDIIPIPKWRDVYSSGNVEVINVLDGVYDTTTKQQLQLIFDVNKVDKQIKITSGFQRPLTDLTPDLNPISRNCCIEFEDQSEVPGVSVDITSQKEKTVDATKLTSKTGEVSKKSLLITDDFDRDTSADSKSVTVDYLLKNEVDNGKYVVSTDKSVDIQYIDENEVNGISVDASSQKEKTVDAANLTSKKNEISKKTILVSKDTKGTVNSKGGNLIYEMYKSLARTDRAIDVTVRAEARTRYMISVNNGAVWRSYNATTKQWVTGLLQDIDTCGMTIAQMADPTVWDSLSTDYRNQIKFAIGVRNESYNSTITARGLTVEFEPNAGPQINNATCTLNDDNIEVAGWLYEAENDTLEYRVLTKEFNETEYRQIMPEQVGWYKRDNSFSFDHKFDFSNFRTGENLIKVQSRDGRGTINEKEFSIMLITGKPTITLNSNNEFYMNATIAHTLGKDIRFQVYINNKQVTPLTGFTDYFHAPFSFDYSWDSKDLLLGVPNEIKIVAIDQFNTTETLKFNVIGGYRSLLFKDENNFYYSTDKGEILKQLDFGTVIGGLIAAPAKVILENRTGLTLENVRIWADNPDPLAKVQLKLSQAYDPFADVDTFTLPNTMANGETQEFYVRIDSSVDATSVERKVFKIYASGDPVVAQ